MLYLPERWNLVFLDLNHDDFPNDLILQKMNLLKIENHLCCKLQGLLTCHCPKSFNVQKMFLFSINEYIAKILAKMADNNYKITDNVVCFSKQYDLQTFGRFREELDRIIDTVGFFQDHDQVYKLNIDGVIERQNHSSIETIAKYHDNELIMKERMDLKPPKTFYRIGITFVSQL